MTSLLSLSPDTFAERPAKSSLPWVWFGFFFVAAFIIEETLMVAFELDESVSTIVLIGIAIGGYIYWLFCVYRMHKVLGEISGNKYPISGAEAAAKHFIPFYNLVWVFRWPAAMSDYLNRRGRVSMISGGVLGVVLLLSLLITRFLDTGIGLTGMFAVGMYMTSKLRRHIEQILKPENLPPSPDPTWFSSSTPSVHNKPSD